MTEEAFHDDCIKSLNTKIDKLEKQNSLLTYGLLREKNKIQSIKKQFAEDAVAVNEFYYPTPVCEKGTPELFSGWNACLSCRFLRTCRLLFGEEQPLTDEQILTDSTGMTKDERDNLG